MKFFAPLAAGLAAALTLPTLAAAQAEPLVFPDRSEVEVGTPYVAEVFRDWQIRCIRGEDDQIPERCEMFQLLEEENGNPVTEMRVSVPIFEREGDDTAANMTLLTPLDTLLSPGLELRIDDNEPAVVPYAFCQPIGCIVQLTLGESDVEVFRNGADAQITLVALVRGDNGDMGGVPVPTIASLRGFTAAFESIQGRADLIRQYIAEQQEAASE